MFNSSRRSHVNLDLEAGAGRKGQHGSSENLLIFPRSRSLRRGWVMPSRRAARACVVFQPRTFSLIAIMTLDRIVIVTAPSGLSSSASHTLAKVRAFIVAV